MSEITPKEYFNILTKGLQSSLNSTPIEDGKLRYTFDTGNLYLDVVQGESSTRVKISDIVMGMTEEEIGNILVPLPKLYLALDTNRLYFYDPVKGWRDTSGSKLVQTERPDSNQSIWFSENDETQPSYDDTFSYNSADKKLNVTNISTSDVKAENIDTDHIVCITSVIDGMKIVTSEDEEGNKISDFSFITGERDTDME